MENKTNYIHLGSCTKPHGIKGYFSFKLFNLDSSLKVGSKILLKPINGGSAVDADGQNFVINHIQIGNKAIVGLETVSGRNRVEELIPFEIFIDRLELPALTEEEFYLNDLVGFKVLDAESKRELGSVKEFGYNGAQDLMVIHEITGELTELPMTDAFVKEVNLKDQVVWVVLPEYI